MFILLVLLTGGVQALASDPPHDSLACTDCHLAHGAPGVGLTAEASNVNLCLSCHNPAGTASAVPFSNSMQAEPEQALGTSHSWNGTMPSSSSPSNPYGLRATADLADSEMRARLENFNNKVVCSVCHNQHSQERTPWDPASPGTPGLANRHFMRSDNELNQLCQDCHYYRAMGYAQAKDSSLANGTTVFSHPVGDILNSQGYDLPAPLDANGVAQTDPSGTGRYAGDADGIPENNLVLDATAQPGGVRCLSCHRVHYTDSNSLSRKDDLK
jgi:predicted CXXCH cytochrome family protein